MFKVRVPTVTQVFGHDPLDSHLLSISDIVKEQGILELTKQFELRIVNAGAQRRIF
jgi:hypothetical protein